MQRLPLWSSPSCSVWGGSFSFLLPHTHNIVSLDCTHVFATEKLTEALPNFPKSMPNLRTLALNDCTYLSRVIDPLDSPTHTTLRELSLHSFPLLPSILALRTLTEFHLCNFRINIHVDTLLSFLEENRSLEHASFNINFEENSLCCSQRQTPVETGLQHLYI